MNELLNHGQDVDPTTRSLEHRYARQRQARPGRRTVLRRLDDVAMSIAVRTGASPRAVLGVGVLVAAILLVLAGRAVVAHRAGQPVPIAPTAPTAIRLAAATGTSTALPAGSPTATAESSAGGVAARLVVHVVGQVRHPGVVVVAAGGRVQDAVRAAGGPKSGADLSAVNLARPLVDGEQIVVPRPGEPVVPAPGTGPPDAPAGGSGGAAGGRANVQVALNTASAEQLDSLPGVGPVLAGRIIDFRTEHGRFTSVDELGEVSGIGDKVLERLRPLVRL